MCHHVGSLPDGEYIIAVQPFAFPIKITSGRTSLVRAILRNANTPFLHFEELRGEYAKEVLITNKGVDSFTSLLKPQGLEMTFFTRRVYRARRCDEPIDMDARDLLDPTKYFERIDGKSEIVIDPRVFYLFGTREIISLSNVCGRLSRESSKSGTGLWSHFAGFFDPGLKDASITLECYSFAKRFIREGECAGFVVFDKVEGSRERGYNGAYQNQKAPMLPKMFKKD
jgi:deoxycytidine triphosphate deaminase